MALIESELNKALQSSVKRKANRTQKLKAKAKRVSRGATEVMVKITGFGKGAGHVKAHLDYITRNGKLELENDRGEVMTGKAEVKDFFKDWEKDFGDSKRHKNQRDTMHMVLSMPEGTDELSVKNAVREFARATFGRNHEYVFAHHTDEPHPHCHLTVKCLGFDGKRLNPRKADLQRWREGFAEHLRDQGVDAEATPRGSRGVVKKADRSVVRHIERGDKTHKPRVPKVKAAQVKEASDQLSQDIAAETNGLPVDAKPWEKILLSQQKQIRRAWLSAAEALENENPRLTFNNKEPVNERPNYDRINTDRARAIQRAAAVYQSNLEKSGQSAPPGTLPGLRNLSRVSMVQHARSTKMLLQPDAPDRMGRQRTADLDLRRSGIGASRTVRSAIVMKWDKEVAVENKALAAQIRDFVDALPRVDKAADLPTAQNLLKRDLRQRFTKQAEAVQSVTTGVQAANEQKKGADQAAPRSVGKDVER
ncbi:Nickase [Candidatus Methylobacter favarea]|uniref:Nickase n=2 Tax=Candidatus Methylobacter favarea TaxID=2707345 RepID=A0A8S0XII8_9GAMM|nr:Nickase [Candidatus Methylobacter favarea]